MVSLPGDLTSRQHIAIARDVDNEVSERIFIPSAQNAVSGDLISEVKLDSSSMVAGGVSLTPKFAAITASSSGNTQIVAAVLSKKIRVLAYNYMADGTVNVKWQSATSDKTGLAFLISNTGKVCNFNPVGWFETNSGEALNINLSAAVSIGGELTYVEI